MLIFLDIKRETDCNYIVQNECSEQVIPVL